MKCPKCGYLGFEQVDRCRNCGYEFSLAAPPAFPELPMRRPVQTDADFEDLALVDAAAQRTALPDSKFPLVLPTGAIPGAEGELPFGLPLQTPAHDDTPLITRASAPRAPLSVRRAVVDAPRPRAEAVRAPMLDLEVSDLDLPAKEEVNPAARAAQSEWTTPARADAEAAPVAAGAIARIAATVIDLAILSVVDLAVIYFTMQICGLTVADLGALPAGPLIAFILLQNGGYLVAFTAGGQTLGKLATGIRVVAIQPNRSVSVGDSILRTVVWVILLIPGGLGFLTTLFSRDRRGLHDRCAGTRVVRASA